MIAAIEAPQKLCIVLHTARKGLKAIATSYCSVEYNAADGVVQVHDSFFREGKTWISVVNKREIKACPICKSVSGIGGEP